MTRPSQPHAHTAPDAKQVAEALHRVELALCLLAGIEQARETEACVQQALSRIRVLAVQAGACVAYCYNTAQLRVVLQTRRSQLETESRNAARLLNYEAVTPIERWRIRSDKAR